MQMFLIYYFFGPLSVIWKNKMIFYRLKHNVCEILIKSCKENKIKKNPFRNYLTQFSIKFENNSVRISLNYTLSFTMHSCELTLLAQ